MSEYIKTKTSVDLKTLTTELNAAITSQAVGHLTWNAPDILLINYSTALDSGDETTMNSTVTAHTG